MEASRVVKLPLRCINQSSPANEIKEKYWLLKKVKLLSASELSELEVSFESKELTKMQKEKLLSLVEKYEINEFDRAELFACFLGSKEDRLPDSFIESLDPSPHFNKSVFKNEYHQNIRVLFKTSVVNIRKFALPRIRAKVAIRELVLLKTKDENLLLDTVSMTPRYLKCDFINAIIVHQKSELQKPDNKMSKSFFKKLDLAIRGGKKKPSREYSYWTLDYFFNEVVACLIQAKSLSGEERREYLRAVAKTWDIPSDYHGLLNSGLSRPKETVLDLMIHKKMLKKDVNVFRNKVLPAIKRVKEENPFIRACDPMIEKKLLDALAKSPDILNRYDVWRELEEFEFDETLFQSDRPRHAISTSMYAVRV